MDYIWYGECMFNLVQNLNKHCKYMTQKTQMQMQMQQKKKT